MNILFLTLLELTVNEEHNIYSDLISALKSRNHSVQIACPTNSITSYSRLKNGNGCLRIKTGEKIVYKNDPSLACTVAGDRTINYNGEITSVSALAQRLLSLNHPVQGTLHFTYNGELLCDLRERLENEGRYGK